MSLMLSSVIEVIDSITVSQHNAIVVPLVAQDIDEQTVTGTAGHTFEAVVGAHHLADITFLNQCLESRQIGLPKVTRIDSCIIGMTQRLRSAVHGIVLGTSVSLEVVRVIALHAENSLNTKNSIQVGVFTAGFLSASPTRVTEDVHVRAPKRQLRVTRVIGGTHLHVKDVMVGTVPVGTSLIADLRENIIDKLLTEGGSQSDRLRIDRIASLTYAMTGLTPPVIRRDAEAVDRYGLVHHQAHLLLRGKQ